MNKVNEQHSTKFINEIILNEYTLREITLGLWTYRKGKNKLPVVLLLLALCCPVIYAFAAGKPDAVILVVPILVVGLIALFCYLGQSAYKAAKSREKMIKQILKEHGTSETLRISFDEQINYTFDGKYGVVCFDDIEKVIELDMYLVLELKGGVDLPIWKIGFTEGNWDDFIVYLKLNTF